MIKQASGERCYHMFYQLLAGASQDMLSMSVCLSVFLRSTLSLCVVMSICLPVHLCLSVSAYEYVVYA